MNLIKEILFKYKERKKFFDKVEKHMKKKGKVCRTDPNVLRAFPYCIKTNKFHLFYGDNNLFPNEGTNAPTISLNWIRASRIRRFFRSQINKLKHEDFLSRREKCVLYILEDSEDPSLY